MASVPLKAVDGSVLVLQLTDSHLFAEASGKLLGLDTGDSLQRVIDLALAEQPGVDLLLASGDLSQDGSVASYERFKALTSVIPAVARWYPGNHDDRDNMIRVARGSDLMNPVIDIGNWRIVMLDSLVPGSVAGHLADGQLELLDEAIASAAGRHVLVSFHHHPVSIGSQWMDRIGLRNADALFSVLDRYPQVRAILWGHIHQAFDGMRNGVRLLASPSTGIQFMPRSHSFGLDGSGPGYRWLRLAADGTLTTGISRVEGLTFTVEEGATGY